MTRHRAPREGPGVGMVVVTAAAVVAGLHVLGRGVLAAPSVDQLDDLGGWATAQGPVAVGLVVLRLVALGVAYHLLATTALGLVGRLLERPGLVHWAERATLPVFRSMVRRAAGLGLSASAALLTPLPTVAAEPAGTVAPAVLGQLDPDPADPRSDAVLRRIDRVDRVDRAPGTASLRLVTPVAPAGSAPTAGPTTPAPPPEPPSDELHTVRPGDHLWAIAEAGLTDELGRPPTDADVAPRWHRLVAANPQLTDPDLLLPGDTIRVPRADPPDAATGEATLRRAPVDRR